MNRLELNESTSLNIVKKKVWCKFFGIGSYIRSYSHNLMIVNDKNSTNLKWPFFCILVDVKKLYIYYPIFFFYLSFSGQNLSSNSTGSFTYTPNSPLNNQPVDVYYHIPEGEISTMPIVFSFHGAARNADNYRDFWISMADENSFIVIAPEFSSDYYPELGDDYLMGNVYIDGDNPTPESRNPENEWTFSIIDPLFDAIVDDIGGNQTMYKAWGHSGGAQFLHRLLLFLPDSRLEVAVCSNAGWYTVPEFGISFPYGLDNSEISDSNLINIFSSNLIVHLGENDNNPNSAGLRHNNVLDNQQGLNRFERGNYFFDFSMSFAEEMNTTFNWELHTVPNTGHNGQQMANDALSHLLASNLNLNNSSYSDFKVFPNPSNDQIFFNNNRLYFHKIEVFDLIGQSIVLRTNINTNSNSISLKALNPGIYLVIFSNDKEKNVFKIIKN